MIHSHTLLAHIAKLSLHFKTLVFNFQMVQKNNRDLKSISSKPVTTCAHIRQVDELTMVLKQCILNIEHWLFY